MNARALLRIGTLAVVLALGGCRSDPSGDDPDSGAPQDASALADVPTLLDAASPDGTVDAASGCESSSACDSGICLAGACCPDPQLVCGAHCCAAGQRCFAGACIDEGTDCLTAGDCQPGQYCQPGLDSDAGVAPHDGGTCVHPSVGGRCLDAPPACPAADAGVPGPDGGGCTPASCEYVAPSGELAVAQRWQWGYNPAPIEFPNRADVWTTPVVGRLVDTNCDGELNGLDAPSVVVLSANNMGTYCGAPGVQSCGTTVLRVLDGRTGSELWSLEAAEPTSGGFAGITPALGDITGDGRMEIVAVTGEGKIAVVDADGIVVHLSTDLVDGYSSNSFGWGGAVALADMDGYGDPEIAFGRTVFTTSGGALTLQFVGTLGNGGTALRTMSIFGDVNGDGTLELIAGNTAYLADGTPLWQSAAPDGFNALADFDDDDLPEVLVVANGMLYLLEGATGDIELGPFDIPGNGSGGPPVVADFNGDGEPEIGIAMQNYYSMLKPDYANATFITLWSALNHDNSSSVTGSAAFDFEGDGAAEVVYADECFFWILDGATGAVRYAGLNQSTTATESPVVADIDGDGAAEVLFVHNGADPNSWTCAHHTTGADGYPIWSLPAGATAYRGVTALTSANRLWPVTRTLWNQATYHVTNICGEGFGLCPAGSSYGSLPTQEVQSFGPTGANNYRQNPTDITAPDAQVELLVDCDAQPGLHAFLRNLGHATLAPGVELQLYVQRAGQDELLGTVTSTSWLRPGEIEELTYTTLPADSVTLTDAFFAQIHNPPTTPRFRECRFDNNSTAVITPVCPAP